MTLLIVNKTANDESVLELHGWLRAPEIAEFAKALAAAAAPVCIDLANLVGADPAGLLALREARANGGRLRGASPYMELLLEPSGGKG